MEVCTGVWELWGLHCQVTPLCSSNLHTEALLSVQSETMWDLSSWHRASLTFASILRCCQIRYILLTGQAWEGISVIVPIKREKWSGCENETAATAHVLRRGSVLRYHRRPADVFKYRGKSQTGLLSYCLFIGFFLHSDSSLNNETASRVCSLKQTAV